MATTLPCICNLAVPSAVWRNQGAQARISRAIGSTIFRILK